MTPEPTAELVSELPSTDANAGRDNTSMLMLIVGASAILFAAAAMIQRQKGVSS